MTKIEESKPETKFSAELPKIQGKGKGRRGPAASTLALLAECKLHKGEWTVFKMDVSKSYAAAMQSSKRFPGFSFKLRTEESGQRICYVSWQGETAALADMKEKEKKTESKIEKTEVQTPKPTPDKPTPEQCKHSTLSVPAGRIRVCPDCEAEIGGPFNLRALAAESFSTGANA